MNEIVREFLLETHENLAQLDLDLVTLEKEPTERETLARVFRTLHTVKGTAGFLGLPKLQTVSHAAENLLSRLRAGELAFQGDIASTLLTVVDAVRAMLASIEATENEGSVEYGELIQSLERLTRENAGPVGVKPAAPPRAEPPPPSVRSGPQEQQTAAMAALPSAAGQSLSLEPADGAEPRAAAVSDSSIRVDVGLLNKLMNLVGELVLARNQIMQCSAAQGDDGFFGPVQRLNQLTTELQAGVMKTRMQPIGNIWAKFPRLVRDISVACNKKVRLEMEGKETELDRSIIESIRDPLTHLVRNAIDHGIETPADREARGKLPEGRLSLRAYHEGGKVIIEISDDGCGIDPVRVRDKAIAVKLITPEQAARMSDREIINLIFMPGFSTAERVSNFSGRGVGMDVVRTNIEKVGGSVNVDSRLGEGTTVKMKIPLTLAIIPALTVTSDGDRYAIPQVSLLELVRLEGEQGQHGIEDIHGAPVYRLRGSLLPIVYLKEQLQLDHSTGANSGLNIVVLQADERQFGLVVDEIHDTEEIVVKPLQKQLKGIGLFAGATIMGDGKVALILDVLGLAQRAHVVSEVRERSTPSKTGTSGIIVGDRQTVLVCAARDGSRIGIPLSLVARLEEFPSSSLERVGSNHVVQYRDEILPLIDVARALRQCDRAAAGSHGADRDDAGEINDLSSVQVVVYAVPNGHVGLVVREIVDVVEEAIVTRARARRAGVLYTAVIQGRVTEFIDIEKIVRTVDPELFEYPTPA